MKMLDSAELALCRMQGELFERSPELTSCSSPVFIRRFMNSRLAKRFDAGSLLQESSTMDSLVEELEQEYGPSEYGQVRYGTEVLYWMGYLYRYWCIGLGISSKSAYKVAPARELSELYVPYHSLDPAQAIERIYEAKGIPLPPSTKSEGYVDEGVEILRRMHQRDDYDYYVFRY